MVRRLRRGDPAIAADWIARALRGMKRPLFREMKNVLLAEGEEWKKTVQDRLTGGPLFSRSNKLRRSIRYEVRGRKLGDLTLRKYVDPRVKHYSATHEEGRPNILGNEWLTIPVNQALTAKGVPRKKRAMDWGKDFLEFRRRGSDFGNPDPEILWLVPKGEPLKDAYYILKRSVSVDDPAKRLHMEKTHQRQNRDRIQRLGIAARRALSVQ